MSRRGFCEECGREYVVTDRGVIRQHWAPQSERRGRLDDWTCPGAGKKPIGFALEPISDAIARAERRGYDRAVGKLRDSQQHARYLDDRAAMKIAADYLEATKETDR